MPIGSGGFAGLVGAGESDQELLQRVAEGDRRAIGGLYDRHAADLLPVAVRILRDRAEAEDLVHDAFVALGDRAGQYVAERGSVMGWLVTIVRNLCIDRLRQRGRRGVAVPLLRQELEGGLSDLDPESLTAEARERHAIRRLLDELPEAQRTTLETAFFEGLSYPEMAARENVPLGTIKSRAARALAAMRHALAVAEVPAYG